MRIFILFFRLEENNGKVQLSKIVKILPFFYGMEAEHKGVTDKEMPNTSQIYFSCV